MPVGRPAHSSRLCLCQTTGHPASNGDAFERLLWCDRTASIAGCKDKHLSRPVGPGQWVGEQVQQLA